MIDFVIIGKRIKHHRKDAKMTQANLAEKLNVSANYISQVERGIASVSLARLGEIAGHIQTPLQLLLTDINTKEENYLSPEFAAIINPLPAEKKQHLLEVMESIIKYNKL